MPFIRFISKIFFLKFLFRKRLHLLNTKKILYKEKIINEDIYNFQLDKFNKVWHFSYKNIPFYSELKKKYNLPNHISSLKEIEEFPVLTKEIITKNKDLILQNLSNYYLISTGGTSGVNTYFPSSTKDANEAYANMYVGRSWWGIKPFSKIIMFWGHSHLFGNGILGEIKHFFRKIKNAIINTERISSYDLDVDNLEYFYSKIHRKKFDALLSYTSNMFMIAKYMEKNNLLLPKNIKNIILTSETVTQADIDLISKRISPRIINEYGMAETGVIAYSYDSTNNIRVLWDSFIINIKNDGRLFITTISEKTFPLINYDSEDLAKPKEIYNGSVLYINEIKGKTRNILKVKNLDGSFRLISTIFFDHILKYEEDIYSIHYIQNAEKVEIVVSSNKKLDLDKYKLRFIKKAKKEFNFIDFSKINISQGKTKKTIAGKRNVIFN